MSRTFRLKHDSWKLRKASRTFRLSEDHVWIECAWGDRFDYGEEIHREIVRGHVRARADRCPGKRNAPKGMKRQRNGVLRAKQGRELRRMIEDEGVTLTPFKRDANWHWF